ncbi:MAG: hypothetical protein NTV81_03890 [Candidatus Komeilibacteria bacterium]|nr:hypothetical protein [Candidatus Komeilibacteria bacterium]
MLLAPLPDHAWQCLDCGYLFGTCQNNLPGGLPSRPNHCPKCQDWRIEEKPINQLRSLRLPLEPIQCQKL